MVANRDPPRVSRRARLGGDRVGAARAAGVDRAQQRERANPADAEREVRTGGCGAAGSVRTRRSGHSAAGQPARVAQGRHARGARELRRRLTAEKDPLVAQDLQILVKAAQSQLDGLDLSEKYNIPYINVPAVVFSGLHALLDDQIPEARRKAALVRLRKYAGLEPGFSAADRTGEGAEPATGSGRDRLVRRRSRSRPTWRAATFSSTASPSSSRATRSHGYEEPFAKLKQQLTDYQAWTRRRDAAGGARATSVCSRNSMRSRCASSASTCRRRSWSKVRACVVRRMAARGAADRRADRQGARLDVHRLPRRDSRAEEGSAVWRRDPAALPGAAEGDRSDHRARASRDAAGPPGAHPDRAPPPRPRSSRRRTWSRRR